MTSDPPDFEQLDETASAYLDGVLGPDERASVERDPRVLERIQRFTALRAELLGPLTSPGRSGTDGGNPAAGTAGVTAQREDAQIVAALAAFDEIYGSTAAHAGTDLPLDETNLPLDETASPVRAVAGEAAWTGQGTASRPGHPREAPVNLPVSDPVSLDDRRRERDRRRHRAMTLVGAAAAVALAVFGLSRLGTGTESKTSSGATSAAATAAVPAPVAAAATTTTRPGLRSSSGASEAVGAAAAATTAVPAAAAPAVADSSSSSLDVPALSTAGELASFVQQRLSTVKTSPGAGGPVAPGGGAPSAAVSTTASATAGTAAGGVTPAAAPTPARPAGTACDSSAGALDLGTIMWRGEVGEVIVHAQPDGHGVTTVYAQSCRVLTQQTSAVRAIASFVSGDRAA